MRALILAVPLLLLPGCALFGGSSEPQTPPHQDAAAIVAAAVDDAQAVNDKRLSDMRATLEQISSDQARLRDQLADYRKASRDDADSALAAEATAAKAQHLLLLTGVVAGLASVASIILAFVVVWQAVLLRRAQRAGSGVDRRYEEAAAAERAAMAASRPAASAAAPAAAPAAPAAGPFARLRRRPPN